MRASRQYSVSLESVTMTDRTLNVSIEVQTPIKFFRTPWIQEIGSELVGVDDGLASWTIEDPD